MIIKIVCDSCESPLTVLGGLYRIDGEMALEFKVVPCEVCQRKPDVTLERFVIKDSLTVVY